MISIYNGDTLGNSVNNCLLDDVKGKGDSLYNSVNNCLLDDVKGNGGCHSHGTVNYNTLSKCDRKNIVPLYVQDICKTKANGCMISYNHCVKKLTHNSNCDKC